MILLRIIFVSLLLGIGQFPAPVTAATKLRLQTVDGTLQVCVNQQTGEPLVGDIELMLVMDNSLSLSAKDPSGTRFLQVRTMLESVHDRISNSRRPRDVRFSLITFAGQAVVKISRANAVVLNNRNLTELGDVVKAAAPGDKSNTNYVAALDSALEDMQSAPAQNCRVVVWFTDGAYWPSIGALGNSQSGGDLREKVCGAGGFSDRLRSLNINIFPLYIEGGTPGENERAKADPTASRDIMAHLTGDQDSFGESPYQAGPPCAVLPSHIGEVLAASDVNQVGQFFADLPNIIEGGIPIACPTKEGRVESKPLPAGRYIAQISIVKYALEGNELSPSDLVARQPDGTKRSLDTYYKGKSGRYEATQSVLELQSGWIIEGSGEEHCIRAFAREGLTVQLLKKGQTTSLLPYGPTSEWLIGEELVSDKSDSVLPIVRLGKEASCKPTAGLTTDSTGLEEAFAVIADRGTGRICVDVPGSDVFTKGISLTVVREGLPLIDCENIKLKRSGADEFITDDRTEQSTECEIDFGGSGSIFKDVASSFQKGFLSKSEAAACNIDVNRSKVNTKTSGEVVRVSLSVVFKENRKTVCNLTTKKIVFNFLNVNGETQRDKVAVVIALSLQPAPDRLAALIATIVTVAILLAIAFWILRRMTVQAAALTAANKLFAVRFAAQVSRLVDKRISLSIENRALSDIRLEMGRVERAQVMGSDSELVLSDQGDQVVIRRTMPPIRAMLREPWAWVDDTRSYVVHPPGRKAPANQHLTAPFRDAIVAIDEGALKGSPNVRLVSLWVIHKKGASSGDQVVIEESLKESALALVGELMNNIEQKDGDDEVSDTQASTGVTPPELGGESVPSNDMPPPPDWP